MARTKKDKGPEHNAPARLLIERSAMKPFAESVVKVARKAERAAKKAEAAAKARAAARLAAGHVENGNAISRMIANKEV